MKKSILLLIALGIAFFSYSQRVLTTEDAKQNVATLKQATGFETLQKNEFEPTKSIVEISNSTIVTGLTYDWQTNAGLIGRIYAWDDGTVGTVWTHSRTETFNDRGTGTNYYNGTEWTGDPETIERIEPVKTGFGSYAPWGVNGEATVAHSSAGVMIISMRETKGEGDWTQIELNPPTGMEIMWPDMWSSGENREYLHILYVTTAEYLGQASCMLYSRYNSATQTWEEENYLFPYVAFDIYPEIGNNSYTFMKTEKDVIAFIVNDAWSDGFVLKSFDNGQTWEQIMFYQHAGPFADFTDKLFFYPRYVSGAFDSQGKLHLAYEFNGSTGIPGSGSYYPGIGGIVYWNEDMPVRDTTYLMNDVYLTTWIYSDATGDMPNEYIGYYLCLDPNSGEVVPMSEVLPVNWDDPTWYPTFCAGATGDHGSYNSGPICMPELMIDDQDNIYVIWVGIADNYCYDASVNFYRIFGRASSDGGATWNDPTILTKGFLLIYKECVYPYMAPKLVNGNIFISYQEDDAPGTFVMGNHELGVTGFTNLVLSPSEFGIDYVNISEYDKQESFMKVAPNPAHSQVELTVNGTAQVNIYNIMGQLIKSVGTVNNSTQVDISGLNPGVYLISANQNGKISSQKLIVQ